MRLIATIAAAICAFAAHATRIAPRNSGVWERLLSWWRTTEIVIHFIVDPQTGVRTDFKFK